jgi:mannitol/fructose-specific phosphotransferase system IIA component (Ntr-type)
MNLTTFFEMENIVLDVESRDHLGSLVEVMNKVPQNGRLRNNEKALRDLLEREKLSSTGIGGGFAVPHVFTEEANLPTLVFARSKKGIKFQSLDKKPVHLLLLAFAHPRKKTFFILCLYHIVRLLKDPEVFKQLMEAEGAEEIVRIFERRGVYVDPELLKPVFLEIGNGRESARLEAGSNGNGKTALGRNGNGSGKAVHPQQAGNGNGSAEGKHAPVSNPVSMVGQFLARAVKEVIG